MLLVVNAGSSSLKLAVFDAALREVAQARVIGCQNGARFLFNHGVTALRSVGGSIDHVEATDDQGRSTDLARWYLFQWKWSGNLGVDLLIGPFAALFGGVEAGGRVIVTFQAARGRRSPDSRSDTGVMSSGNEEWIRFLARSPSRAPTSSIGEAQ